MKNLYILSLILFIQPPAHAQIEQLSAGANYAQQTFYSIKDGSSVQYEHTTWDIAFAVGAQDLGVFVNEAVASSMAAPLPQVELYTLTSTEFESADTAAMVRIYNNEISWEAGAFNHVSDLMNPFDFGWGSYDVTTHQVYGSRIFGIKLRDGAYKKLEIQSLASGTYTFRYADLDGENEVIQSVAKADFAGKTLAYYSFAADSTMDLEPESWDLQFTRYTTPLDDGEGNILQYMVTGILSNTGVEIAQAEGVDPATVQYGDYEGQYSDTLTAIGHDWKSFDLTTFQWSLPMDRVYFVKTQEDELWQLQFIDFEGSSTGASTLEKTFLTTVTALEDRYKNLKSFEVFPNPTQGDVNVAFELDQLFLDEAEIMVSNNLGQILFSQKVNTQVGLNVKEVSLNLPSGLYYMSLRVGDDLISKSLLVR